MKYQFDSEEFVVSYYDDKSEVNLKTNRDTYHLVPVDCQDITALEELKGKGFQFLDRILKVNIDIPATKEIRAQKIDKIMTFSLEISNSISEEMYALACLGFDTDRRFHLQEGFDSAFSAKVLRKYVEFYNEKDIICFQERYKDELAGFTVVHRQEKYCENVLGVTKPGILGKAAAYGMYAGMLDYMLEHENFKEYYAEVSSCNVASMNLHIQLGAKVTGSYDKYIYNSLKKI